MQQFFGYLKRFPSAYPGTALQGEERDFLPPLVALEQSHPSPLPGWVIRVLALTVVSLIVWSYFARIDVVITAKGRVNPLVPAQFIQSPEPASVKGILVRDGDFVRKGQVLVELENIASDTELLTSQARLNSVQSELDRLKAEEMGRGGLTSEGRQASLGAARSRLFESQKSEILAEVDQRKSEVRFEQANSEKFERLVQLSKEQYARIEPMALKGFLPKSELEKAQRDLTTQQQELNLSQARLRGLRDGVTLAEKKLQSLISNHHATLQQDLAKSEMDVKVQQYAAQKAADQKKLRQLLAPVDGWVQRVQMTTLGGVVSAGQVILTLVPSNSEMVVDAVIPSSEIGFVREGQKVDVKIDTFPFTMYGVVTGTLERIGPDAEAGPDQSGNRQVPGSSSSIANEGVYLGRVRLSQQYLLVKGRKEALVPGMTTQVDIVTDNRSVLDLLISPVSKALHQGVRVP